MATPLLNDDGTASMATMIMSSHHAFRRDLACFGAALASTTRDDAALADEWKRFRASLHGHHTSEDNGVFPNLLAKRPELAAVLAQLSDQHDAIDPLLERGDACFANLPAQLVEARDVIAQLARHIAEHLDLEEATVTPHLRDAKQFPAPPNDEALAMYADGFAWAIAGLAEGVREKIFAMLPAALSARIPVASEAFDARCRRVWGTTHAGCSSTSVPGV